MEYSQRHRSDSDARKVLEEVSIDTPDSQVFQKVLENWDRIAKPIDGMGRFEAVTAQIGAIQGTDEIDISKKAVVIMCADNGIVEEGVSQSGQEVTAVVAGQMAKGASSVGKMAAVIGADTIPVDIGINLKEPIPGVVDRKIRPGTRNFRIEPAMTLQEAVRAIFTGIEIVAACKGKGYKILATGEMGIGNTTTSSAVAAALLDCEVEEVTGRGAGLCDEKLQHKRQVIGEAIEKYKLRGAEPLRVLQTVGGLDIAALAGVCIGGGVYRVPVILDGVISMVAALIAQRMVPGIIQYLIPSHKGKEPAVEKLMRELNLEPVIDGKMALGEGTGAVMMMSLLEMALSIYHERTLFSDIQIEQYERFL